MAAKDWSRLESRQWESGEPRQDEWPVAVIKHSYVPVLSLALEVLDIPLVRLPC